MYDDIVFVVMYGDNVIDSVWVSKEGALDRSKHIDGWVSDHKLRIRGLGISALE